MQITDVQIAGTFIKSLSKNKNRSSLRGIKFRETPKGK